MSTVLTSREAEDLFPAGTCTQSTYIHHIYTCMNIYVVDKLQADTHNTHRHKGNTNSVNIHKLYIYIYIYTYMNPLADGFRLSLPSRCLKPSSQLQSTGHESLSGYSPAPVAGTDHLADHTHTAVLDFPSHHS